MTKSYTKYLWYVPLAAGLQLAAFFFISAVKRRVLPRSDMHEFTAGEKQLLYKI